jgi:hypothetical protein
MRSARAFLANLGFDLDGYRSYTQPQNRVDSMASQYVYSRAGIQGLNSIYGPQLVPLAWQARFYKPLQNEEYQVSLDPTDGEVVAFHHTLPEDEEGANVPGRRAEQIAASFVSGRGFNLADFRLKETLSEKRRHRRDTVFIWEALPRTLGAVGEARLSLQAGVFGKRIGDWDQFVKIPEQWRRSRQSRNLYGGAILGIRTAFGICMLALALHTLARATRRGLVQWRIAGGIGAAATLLEVADVANRISLLAFQYDTRIDMRVYLATSLAEELLPVIGIGLAAAMAAAVAMACYPNAPAVLRKSGRLAWGRDCAIAVAAALGGYLSIQWSAGQLQYRACSLMTAPALLIPGGVGSYVPLVSDIHNVLMGALFLSTAVGFAIHVWSRLAGRPFPRTVLSAGLLFSVIPSSARQVSEVIVGAIPAVLVVALAGILAMVFLRDNCLAYLMCAAAVSLARISLWSLPQGNPGLRLQGGLIWALMLCGLAFLAFRGVRDRKV